MKINEWSAFVKFHQGVCPWCHKILKDNELKTGYLSDSLYKPSGRLGKYTTVPMLVFCNQKCVDKWRKKYE